MDDLVLLGQLDQQRQRRPRRFLFRPDHFATMRDDEFREKFRFTKEGARYIVDLIRPDVERATNR